MSRGPSRNNKQKINYYKIREVDTQEGHKPGNKWVKALINIKSISMKKR